ncbi:MAG: DNA recombination protein RmuC [bacterium]
MLETLIAVSTVIFLAGFGIIIWKLNRRSDSPDKSQMEELTRKSEELASGKRVAEEKIAWLNDRINVVSQEARQKDSAILELHTQISRKEAENNAIASKLSEQKAEIDNLQEKFRIEFKNLANEILEEKTQKFTEQNKTRLEEILKPLGDKIRDFEKKVEETYDKESKQRFSLEKEIKQLAELNQQISKDATNLTNALKADVKKQGNWGELILERVLESSGLVKGLEYSREVVTKAEQGDVYRPDVVVNLPDNKHIIIDAKVSLIAYNDYVNCDDPEEKDRLIRQHLNSIRNHIKYLSEKNYQNLKAFDTPDYVLLFIPIESSFSLALQNDTELFQFAWLKQVVIVSPTTLLATLRTIASIWKHEKQTQNVLEIARQGGLLYDKFVSFLADLEKIGVQLDSTKKSYDEAHKKLASGSGNLIGRVEKLKELGVKSSKEIPLHLKQEIE